MGVGVPPLPVRAGAVRLSELTKLHVANCRIVGRYVWETARRADLSTKLPLLSVSVCLFGFDRNRGHVYPRLDAVSRIKGVATWAAKPNRYRSLARFPLLRGRGGYCSCNKLQRLERGAVRFDLRHKAPHEVGKSRPWHKTSVVCCKFIISRIV